MLMIAVCGRNAVQQLLQLYMYVQLARRSASEFVLRMREAVNLGRPAGWLGSRCRVAKPVTQAAPFQLHVFVTLYINLRGIAVCAVSCLRWLVL